VDFSNFFSDVGALGGGNIQLSAAGNIANINAAIPTNARMPMGAPSAAEFLELGGGDLSVKAGADLDGGVYYVERGRGDLTAGGVIKTNSTRSPSLGNLGDGQDNLGTLTWLPTTLFVGKADFHIKAAGDALIGPAANPSCCRPA
jgi:hypothetical protein